MSPTAQLLDAAATWVGQVVPPIVAVLAALVLWETALLLAAILAGRPGRR